ncbi:methyltransferase domain-containing protein [Nonomuraea sp. NPDC049758]|uniref:class I SAM-dependent methyltransferase n=1 Tax=Nonomuraea sp. NPDC049758 TaxID=3154360 RepID=UPI003416CF10
MFTDADAAALYDQLNPWDATRHPSDAFFNGLVMDADAVLDVGCGTGSMLHQALDPGHRGRLVGLDPDLVALDRAGRRTDIEWVAGVAADASWDRQFDLATMAGNAFQCLVSDVELSTSLVAIRRALRDGGRFAFDTRNPQVREWEEWKPSNAGEVGRASRWRRSTAAGSMRPSPMPAVRSSRSRGAPPLDADEARDVLTWPAARGTAPVGPWRSLPVFGNVKPWACAGSTWTSNQASSAPPDRSSTSAPDPSPQAPGERWQDYDLVWCHPDGRPIDAGQNQDEWKEQGVDISVVQEILGHSQLTTPKRYTHITATLSTEAAARTHGPRTSGITATRNATGRASRS